MTAGLETFAKVRALHDGTTSAGEKAAAAGAADTLPPAARSGGPMSTPNEQTAPAEVASVLTDPTPVIVETAPGQFARMTQADLERIRVCGHEAAHAVITYRVGWRVGTFGGGFSPP